MTHTPCSGIALLIFQVSEIPLHRHGAILGMTFDGMESTVWRLLFPATYVWIWRAPRVVGMCLKAWGPCSCPAWLLTRGAVRWPCPSWQCPVYTGWPYMSTGWPYMHNIKNIQAKFSKIHCKKQANLPYTLFARARMRVLIRAYMRIRVYVWR